MGADDSGLPQMLAGVGVPGRVSRECDGVKHWCTFSQINPTLCAPSGGLFRIFCRTWPGLSSTGVRDSVELALIPQNNGFGLVLNQVERWCESRDRLAT